MSAPRTETTVLQRLEKEIVTVLGLPVTKGLVGAKLQPEGN